MVWGNVVFYPPCSGSDLNGLRCTHTYTHTHKYTHTHTHTNIHTHTYTYTYTHTHTHVHTHTRTHIHIHTRTHICKHNLEYTHFVLLFFESTNQNIINRARLFHAVVFHAKSP